MWGLVLMMLMEVVVSAIMTMTHGHVDGGMDGLWAMVLMMLAVVLPMMLGMTVRLLAMKLAMMVME